MKHTDTGRLDMDTLKALAARQSDLCLTVTMNCDEEGVEAEKKNRIRFKNLVSKADEMLAKIGWGWRERRHFLKPLFGLRKNREFWRFQSKGLLVLCDDKGFFRSYRLAFALEKNVITDKRFYLRPVIPHLQENVTFAVVALNRRDARIVFGDLLHEDYRIATPSGALESFDEYLSHYEFEKSLQFVSKTPRGTPLFFGQGVSGDKATENAHLVDYYRHLENWVVTELRKADTDKIFYIADERNEGTYLKVVRAHHPSMQRLKQVSLAMGDSAEYARLAAEHIWKERDEKRLQSIGEYHQRMAQDRKTVSTGIKEVILAAHDRRVQKLILPASTSDKAWGHIREEQHDVELRSTDESTGEVGDELLNLAVIETFLNGGEVVPLNDSDHLWAGTLPQYAALCRW